MVLSDHELERYSRQLMLPDFDLEQQERLCRARVLVVGCGGLGSPLILYLAAAGVGRLWLADGDVVERSNLQRQILFGDAQLGQSKARAAAGVLERLHPHCRVDVLDGHLSGAALEDAVAGVDLVADGSDNYPTRFELNRACVSRELPLVSAAAVRGEGQLGTFHVARGGPCYRCLYPEEGAETALSCRESGVLGPVVGVLGTLQALEVIKVLSGWGETLSGALLVLDLRSYRQHQLAVEPRSGCPDCAAHR